MVAEYQAGRTPNPDIMCNQEMKFGLFWQLAQEQGAQYVATGHYSQVVDGSLLAGVDTNKDQSYFLYRMSAAALPHALMPLGGLTKPQVRAEAASRQLCTASKKDSQGICFIGKIKLKDFLSRYVTVEPGDLIDQHGQVVGQHQGAAFYTIGQRSGLGVGGGHPFFVTGKDMTRNEVYVTTDPQDQDLWQQRMTISQTNWLGPQPENSTYLARLRYRAPLSPFLVARIDTDTWHVAFERPQRAVAIGQSVVIYDHNRVVGGGVINSVG
jgi:tRNA-specific 2-thiouridylase